MSNRTHWRRMNGDTACGKAIESHPGITIADDPAKVDCGGCRYSWAFAVAGLGCADESRPKRGTGRG